LIFADYKMKKAKAGFPVRYVLKILMLGALLAGVVWAVGGPPGSDGTRPEITITEMEVAHQLARWERQWGRAPTNAQLRKAIDGYVRNEILYREALARDMDTEDPRVRMALIQKMQMLAAGQADARGVTEEDLSAFFALRKEQYRIPAIVSLIQVFFRDGTDCRARADNLLSQFQKQEPSEAILRKSGDAAMFETFQEAVTALDLEKLFGTDFTAEVLSLAEGKWSGPVRSGYGLHVVKLFDRKPGRIPDLAEVRGKVETDLRYEAIRAAQEQGYQEIAGKYRVAISDRAELMLRGKDQ
jgi:peptidyl-prolyl cis-trans isomerase C